MDTDSLTYKHCRKTRLLEEREYCLTSSSDEAGGYEIENYRVKPLRVKNLDVVRMLYYSAAFCPVYHIHESERGVNFFWSIINN
jgi:hypothetical protein